MSGVESDMRGIGELARLSGLTVSALRFYDRAGVLVPASVDAVTGYRRYRDDQLRAARLVAALRRVGMPIAEITSAVCALPDPGAVRPLLDRHLRRLEDGLIDARRELAHAHALLDQEEHMTRVTLPAAALAAALSAVRFAARSAVGAEDDGILMLSGILFEAGDGELTLVATDRFRMAVATTVATVEGPPIRVVIPAESADQLSGEGTLTLGEDGVRAGDTLYPAIAGDYPDFRRLVKAGEGPRIRVEVGALKAAVTSAPEVWREHDGRSYPTTVLTLDDDGGLRVAGEHEWDADAEAHVAVNRDFLLEALDAGGGGQLTLELDGPIRPLAIRTAERDRFSLLMPVRH